MPKKKKHKHKHKHETHYTPPTDSDSSPVMLDPHEYLNRDLSWLEFNRRVLHEAADERTPLLERVNFLSIFNSNLDEFVMKRLGLLKRHIEAGLAVRRAGGVTSPQLHAALREKILELLAEQAGIFRKRIRPKLLDEGLCLVGPDDLTDAERAEAESYFRTKVFPVLTPLSVDPGHPFPFISNLSTSLGIALRPPGADEKEFARVKVPRVLPQYLPLHSSESGGVQRFLSLTDLIRIHLYDLFPGMIVDAVMPFRVTRNADVEQDFDATEEDEDLLDVVEQELRLRRFERVVRLEHGPEPDPWILQLLLQELEIGPQDVYEMPGLLDYTTLKFLAELPISHLRNEPWTPLTPKPLLEDGTDVFSVIRSADVLVHHPYDSFGGSVERFVRVAAEDPNVVAIKVTLYRTQDDSPFIDNLVAAAEAGKQVVVLVELKARFDEQRNIQLAQALERAGIHVVYGIVGLKTHTKTALVVRMEPDGLRCYAHIGTGNYHVQTAKLYTDVGILTCRSDLTEDLVDLFHFLTGRSLKHEYRKLLVAPVNMAERFNEMIEREIRSAEAGKPARIIAKMNSLEDHRICKALYKASQAGVSIDLIVRGICILRPGAPGLSERVRVVSIIGRFLEHARIFYFAAGAENPVDGEFYIGSADWMHRNLFHRIEVITPVEDANAKARLYHILDVQLRDRRQAWDMAPDGSYTQRTPPQEGTGPEVVGTHAWLMQLTRRAALPGPDLVRPRSPEVGAAPTA